MRNFKVGKTWGVLGKQQTYYGPTHFMGEKVPLNNNPLNAWDYKKSNYRRIDGVPANAQQGGVVPQDNVTPTPTGTPNPTPTPTITPTNTNSPTPTPTITPTPSPGPAFDPDAAAYLSAVITAGGTVDSTMSAATNNMFLALKNCSITSHKW